MRPWVLYVVEMHTGRRWEPTVGVALTRQEGRWQVRQWRYRNPGSDFRLARYTLQSKVS